MSDAVDVCVVGSGPNGLAAALVLAGAGLRVRVFEGEDTVGGGLRSAYTTMPGFLHDVCSAVHPMALMSPFFRRFGLERHGVTFGYPEVAFAHPLDDRTAVLVWQEIERTAAGLGRDGASWLSTFGPLAAHIPEVADTALSDFRSVPARPSTGVSLALRTLQLGPVVRNLRFRTGPARSAVAGVAAHAVADPTGPVPSAVAALLISLAHGVGWPVPIGGTQTMADAMVRDLVARGGEVVAGTRITSLAELPPARAVLLDVAPSSLLRMADGRLPAGYARSLRRFRPGPGVSRVDVALTDAVPWRDPDCRRAGTLHLVGTPTEARAAEAAVAAGRYAERPYVLVVQPGVVDPSRAPLGRHTLYTYAHVPRGSDRDMTEAVTRQIERFAPGFRDTVLATGSMSAIAIEAHNENCLGGDITGGALTMRQLVSRPALRWDPYRTPIRNVYLCSASTPPGPGVHGMCGVHAARSALRHSFGIRTDPLTLIG